MIRSIIYAALLAALPVGAAFGADVTVRATQITEWKSVFGRIEARDRLPARARLGGTLTSLAVAEGSRVAAGDVIAQIVDEKLDLQIAAVDAQLRAMAAQLDNAMTELQRGEDLLQRGVTTTQRLDALRTQVDVIRGQIGSAQAERSVLLQREAEGAVQSPIDGTVLTVPVSAGSIIMPGEPIAVIGGGGFFLRLAIPERHATMLQQGDVIRIEDGRERSGTLSKLYPQIENGRVIADVEVADLSKDFVDARVLVRLPVGQRDAIMVPAAALQSRMGLDFITLRGADGTAVTRAVVAGSTHQITGSAQIEILSGLSAGDTIIIHEPAK